MMSKLERSNGRWIVELDDVTVEHLGLQTESELEITATENAIVILPREAGHPASPVEVDNAVSGAMAWAHATYGATFRQLAE